MEKEVECDQMSFAADPHKKILDQGSCLRPPPFPPLWRERFIPLSRENMKMAVRELGLVFLSAVLLMLLLYKKATRYQDTKDD